MRLSVCIITYNHEAFIEKAVASVLEQDVNFEYEVVIGEDCSTNCPTASTIERNPKRTIQVKLSLEYHKPEYRARSETYSIRFPPALANTPLFLEGDDYWTSRKKLQTPGRFSREESQGVLRFSSNARRSSAADPTHDYVVPASDPPAVSSFGFLLQDSNPIALGSLVTRRQVPLRDPHVARGHQTRRLAALHDAGEASGDLGFIPLEMSRYRVHPGGDVDASEPASSRRSDSPDAAARVRARHRQKPKELIERRKSHYARWWSRRARR